MSILSEGGVVSLKKSIFNLVMLEILKRSKRHYIGWCNHNRSMTICPTSFSQRDSKKSFGGGNTHHPAHSVSQNVALP